MEETERKQVETKDSGRRRKVIGGKAMYCGDRS